MGTGKKSEDDRDLCTWDLFTLIRRCNSITIYIVQHERCPAGSIVSFASIASWCIPKMDKKDRRGNKKEKTNWFRSAFHKLITQQMNFRPPRAGVPSALRTNDSTAINNPFYRQTLKYQWPGRGRGPFRLYHRPPLRHSRGEDAARDKCPLRYKRSKRPVRFLFSRLIKSGSDASFRRKSKY